MEQREQIYKTCKTCQESKEMSKFRTHNYSCRHCEHNKQKENHLKGNKIYYKRHQEKLKEQNLINYYKRRYNNESLTVPEINLLMVMC